MRNPNVKKVAAALFAAPSTVQSIVDQTGVSYSTVTRALKELRAVPSTGWPTKWSLPVGEAPVYEKSIAPKGIDNVVSVELEEADDWLPRWERARDQFSEGIGALWLAADANPKELREAFSKAAKTLASIAYALQNVEDKPDWFTLLGGELEPRKKTK